MGQPVVLYGSTPTTVAANAVGALSEELALRNWTGKVIQLRELHFIFARSGPEREWYAPATEIELRIGNEPITNGFVPMGAMTWPVDALYAFGAPLHSKLARCTFAHPVYLAPEERIHVRVRPTVVETTPLALQAFVTAVCHVVEGKDPKSGFLPWFAGYVALSRAAQGVYTETTEPPVFQNNFATPLLVDRFIGNWVFDPFRQRVAGGPTNDDYAHGAKFVKVRCEDHLGNGIVRDPTPFHVVFDMTRRYWRAKSVLASKGFFKFTLDSDLRTSSVPYSRQPIIGMLGFRPAYQGR